MSSHVSINPASRADASANALCARPLQHISRHQREGSNFLFLIQSPTSVRCLETHSAPTAHRSADTPRRRDSPRIPRKSPAAEARGLARARGNPNPATRNRGRTIFGASKNQSVPFSERPKSRAYHFRAVQFPEARRLIFAPSKISTVQKAHRLTPLLYIPSLNVKSRHKRSWRLLRRLGGYSSVRHCSSATSLCSS